MVSSADEGDYCSIATTTHGATTITTVDAAAAAANLDFVINSSNPPAKIDEIEKLYKKKLEIQKYNT